MPVFKKENICCRGSEELAKVLKVIKSKGVRVAPDEIHWNNPRNSFAYSPSCKNGTISYASDVNFYKDVYQYMEVTPEIFSIIWLGYNCLKEEPVKKKQFSQTFKIKL
ncbi:MAG: hypothetical protein J6U54_15340 [Clostridiales bacterium]|nr:hypothetical protein [Clostridiales bacterium]